MSIVIWKKKNIVDHILSCNIIKRLLIKNVYDLITGTRDLKGNPLVTVDAEGVVSAGLNCYEIATLLLYYNTIPER